MVKGSSRVTDHWLDQVEAGGVEVSKKDVSKEKLKSLEHLAVLSALTGDSVMFQQGRQDRQSFGRRSGESCGNIRRRKNQQRDYSV